MGEVTDLSEVGGGLLRLATVRAAVDFGRLEQVFVMLHRGPGMDLLYETGEFIDPAPQSAEVQPAGRDEAVVGKES